MTQTRTRLRGGGKDVDVAARKITQDAPRSKHRQNSVWPIWGLCILLGATALSFNLYRLGAPSMWFDEILSVERGIQTLPTVWTIITTTQPNMALYYIFMHFWLSLTQLSGLHPTEFVVRLPSAIFAALATMVVFSLGQRFIGIWGGFTAAALYLLNDLQLVYAQQTRSYALQLLLISIAWFALFATLSRETSQRRWWICFVATMTLAVYSHLFSMLILFSQGVAVAGLLLLPTPWRQNTRTQLRSIAISMATTIVLIVPMILASRQGSKTGWIPIPHLADIGHLFLAITNKDYNYLFLLFILCMLGLAAGIFMLVTPGRALLKSLKLMPERGNKRYEQIQQTFAIGFALVCWLVLPIVVSFIVSQGQIRLFLPRYLVTIVPPLFLLVGLGVATLRWHLVQAILAAALIILALIQVPTYYRSAQVEDWNTTSAWLEQHYQKNDGLVCYDNAQGCQVSMEYYFTAYPTAAHFDSDSPGSFSWVSYDTTNTQGNTSRATDPQALAAYAAKHPRIFFIVGRLSSAETDMNAQSANTWLASHYRQIGQFQKRTVSVYLYDTLAKPGGGKPGQ